MNRVKELRVQAGLTQMELAVRAGINRGTVGMMEIGKIDPSVKTARKLAEALGVDSWKKIYDEE